MEQLKQKNSIKGIAFIAVLLLHVAVFYAHINGSVPKNLPAKEQPMIVRLQKLMAQKPIVEKQPEVVKPVVKKKKPVKRVVKKKPLPKKIIPVKEEVVEVKEEPKIVEEPIQEVAKVEEPVIEEIIPEVQEPQVDSLNLMAIKAQYKKELTHYLSRLANDKKPRILSRTRAEGTVVAKFTIDKSGNIISSSVHKPHSRKVLNKAVSTLFNKHFKHFKSIPVELDQETMEFVVPISYTKG